MEGAGDEDAGKEVGGVEVGAYLGEEFWDVEESSVHGLRSWTSGSETGRREDGMWCGEQCDGTWNKLWEKECVKMAMRKMESGEVNEGEMSKQTMPFTTAAFPFRARKNWWQIYSLQSKRLPLLHC